MPRLVRLATLALAPLLVAAKPHAAPPLPAPSTEVRLDAPGATGTWRLVVQNTGEAPLRLAADLRLLALDLEPPADDAPPPAATPRARRAPKPTRVTCALPADMRPTGSDGRSVVLAPGARFEGAFDPTLYCFGAREQAALRAGARVTARFGFGAAKRLAPPYVVEPDAPDAGVAPARELVAGATVVGQTDDAATSATPASAEDAQAAREPHLTIATPPRVDASSARSLGLTVRLGNGGARTLLVHLRRDRLGFDVAPPTGATVHCGPSLARRGLVPDRFDRLAPGASRSLDVLLGELCPDHTFDRPGLYRVQASVRAPDAGVRWSLNAWTGEATAAAPTVVRVRTGSRPFETSPPKVVTP